MPIPQIMVASLKKTMPNARLVQMTDADTLPIPGVDEVIRKPQTDNRFMCYRLLHLRDFPRGDTVFLDVDVIVRRDLATVFDADFDIGQHGRAVSHLLGIDVAGVLVGVNEREFLLARVE